MRFQTGQPGYKARGALSRVAGRFESVEREAYDDGWTADDEPAAPLDTRITEERVRSLIQRNASPDLPFELSVNPYRGCEHGCIYCYARPAHAYLELSPGLDFESRLFAKLNAAEVLRAEIGRRGYVCSPIAIGANTDCYQPAERRYRITRELIEVLAECQHPLTLVTKSALVERDLDLLGPMGRANLAKVFVTVTTLDRVLARRLEPRAPAPQRRLDTIRALAEAGVPVGVMMAPVIPALNEKSIEEALEAAAQAGATMAGYQMLRLPNELKALFREWLATQLPQRAAHVMSLVQQLRDGRDNDPRFGTRMTGTGTYAELIGRRFELACRKYGLNGDERGQAPRRALDCGRFRRPDPAGQMALF
ncbi:MAG: DNA repair photolyase [Betaproteobacteria bacterium SG8_39]|nr:MAG: DNA repair photolyase [Betaproteobacteria bacterium SG8_39]